MQMTDPKPEVSDTPVPEFDRKQLLKMLVELGPLVAFFTVNAKAGIFWGTGVFMVATLISLVA